ncbi:MAG: ABC transporter substrate-binding protein [Nocardioidaceae bacterium]|nr:ABC transporter substrate-binding protein [Nocardioidaceae bacterium]
MKRRRLTAPLLTLGLLVVAGCGSAATPTDEQETRTVRTLAGEVAVPTEVRRVVVVEGRRDLDVALALDLPVVGFPVEEDVERFDLEAPLAAATQEARDAGAEELFLRGEIDLEAVAAAEPDLILGRAEDVEPVADQLAAIAPTIPLGSVADGGAWQDDLRLVAEATGREERADEIVAAYDARVADLRTTLAGRIDSVRVLPVDWSEEGTGVITTRLQSSVLRDLGARFASSMATAEEAGGEQLFSPEQTDVAAQDADALLMVVDTPDEVAAAEADPLWARLPAVRAGRVVRTDKFTHEGASLTAMHVLDLAERLYAR